MQTMNTTLTGFAFVTDFDARILAGRVGPSSIAMYNRDFTAYKTWAANAEMGGGWMDSAIFARWIAAMSNGEIVVKETKNRPARPLSPKTINRMVSAVKRIMAGAAVQGYVTREVADSFERVDGVTVKALKDRTKANARTRISPADMRRICEAPNVDTLTGIRDHALLLTLASSGCRISEVVTLTTSQIHKKGKGWILTVIGKNQEEDREAPLSVEAYEAIQIWMMERTKATNAWQPVIFTGFQGRSQRPLTTPLDPASAWKAVQKYADATGLVHVKPHDFRRFVGTQLAKDDIRKAQKALGHKSIETTARHYVLDELEPGLTDCLF